MTVCIPYFVVVGILICLQIRRAVVPITAQRTALMNEILSGVKLIKLYAWETSFAHKINDIRSLEVKQLLVAAMYSCFQSTVSWCSPALVTFATFAVNVAWTSKPMSASQVRELVPVKCDGNVSVLLCVLCHYCRRL